MYCCCHLQKILFPDLKMHPSFKPARSGTRRSLALVSFPSCHPASLKAACKLVAGNGFLISAANLIMVTLGNGSMRSQVIALNFSIKGQVPLIFNPLTAAAASHLVLPRVSPPRSRQEPADLTSARLGFASGIFLGGKKEGGQPQPPHKDSCGAVRIRAVGLGSPRTVRTPLARCAARSWHHSHPPCSSILAPAADSAVSILGLFPSAPY